MALHPEIQARAQAELDTVVGHSFERLPSFTDRDSLPYVNAVVLEILRWNPAVPLGEYCSRLGLQQFDNCPSRYGTQTQHGRFL